MRFSQSSLKTIQKHLVSTSILTLIAVGGAKAQQAASTPTVVLFQNVRIFDGTHGQLSAPSNVLVRDNKIETISTSPIPTDRSGRTQIIDGRGLTLMPGLIDAHYHIIFESLPQVVLMSADIGYVYQIAGRSAERTLIRGFTTIRDLGGPNLRPEARNR